MGCMGFGISRGFAKLMQEVDGHQVNPSNRVHPGEDQARSRTYHASDV